MGEAEGSRLLCLPLLHQDVSIPRLVLPLPQLHAECRIRPVDVSGHDVQQLQLGLLLFGQCGQIFQQKTEELQVDLRIFVSVRSFCFEFAQESYKVCLKVVLELIRV